MLIDKPEEQMTLFKEIVYKKLNVRDAELISRKVAHNKARKKDFVHDPTISEFEEKLSETFGTRVHIEKKPNGGQITIDFFSEEDLKLIMELIKTDQRRAKDEMINRFIQNGGEVSALPKDGEPTVSSVLNEVTKRNEEILGPVAADTVNSEDVLKTDTDNEIIPDTNKDLASNDQTVSVPKKEEDTFSLDNFTV